MKTIFLALVLTVVASATVIAQNETQTLFSSGSRVTGWFIDFSNSHSNLNGKNTYMPGFAAGVVMNDNFRAGFAFRSLTYHETYLRFDNLFDEPACLNGGYAGFYLEASPLDTKVLHVSFPLIVGGGGAVYLSEEKYRELDEIDGWDFERMELSSSPFFVIEPGINLELNVTGFMKLYSGVSYRWAGGLDLDYTPRNAFNHVSWNGGIKFGKF